MSTMRYDHFSSAMRFKLLGGVLLILFSTLNAFGALAGQFSGAKQRLDSAFPNLTTPGSIVSSAGSLYIVDAGNGRILKRLPDGNSFELSVSGLSTPLSSPGQITVGSGKIYIADAGNNRIVVLTETTSFDATASVLDLSGLTPSLSNPQGVAVDDQGSVYIADTGNNRVVKVPTSGSPTVLLSAGLNEPRFLAVGRSRELYIADTNTLPVLKLTQQGATERLNNNYVKNATVTTLTNDSDFYVHMAGTANGQTGVVRINSDGSMDPLFSESASSLSLAGIAVDSSGGMYFSSTLGSYKVFKYVYPAVDFGGIQLGTTQSTAIELIFQLDSASSPLTPLAYTSGVADRDFKIVSGPACAQGLQGQDCTVTVSFLPLAPGFRRGALVLPFTISGSESAITVPLYGTGQAPVAGFNPATVTVVETGESQPSAPTGIALDGADNLYVTRISDGAGLLTKIPVQGGSRTEMDLKSAQLALAGVAVDGAGNVFVVKQGENAIMALTTAGEVGNLFDDSGSGLDGELNGLSGLAIDGGGNLYAVETGGQRVRKLAPAYPGQDVKARTWSVLNTGGLALMKPVAVAIDEYGIIYIADAPDSGTPSVVRVLPAGGALPISTGSYQLTKPLAIAVDSAQNVYIADATSSGTKLVRVAPWTGEVSFVDTGAYSLGVVKSLAMDGLGRLYVADETNKRVLKVDFSSPRALAFADTDADTTSTDSPKTMTVFNMGSGWVYFSAAPVLSNTEDFSLDTSVPTQCGSSTTLRYGESCNVSLAFRPQLGGTLSTNVTLTNNLLNQFDATQTFSAAGQGIFTGDATLLTITSSASSITWGQALDISVAVTDTATGKSSTVPTGVVAFTDTVGDTTTSLNSGNTVTLDAEGKAKLTGIVLAGGSTHTITAHYKGLNHSFLPSSNTATVSVAKANATIAGPANQPVQFTFGQKYSLAVTVTGVSGASVPTGMLLYSVDGPPGTVVSGYQPLSSGTTNATASVPLPPDFMSQAGSYSVRLWYSGDDNYAEITTATQVAVEVNKITPTITWAQPAAAITYGTSLNGILNASAWGRPSLSPSAQSGSVANDNGQVAGTFAYTATPAGGTASAVTSATILNAGSYTLTATFTPNDTVNYASATKSVSLTIDKATATIALVSSASPVFVRNAITFTATVASAAATPSGIVNFYDGTTLLGSVSLSQGKAAYTTSSLTAATHSITATYSDVNFSTVTSSAIAQLVQDFTLTIGGTGSGTPASQTIAPGGTATYLLAIAPSAGTVFPAPVTLSLSGLPPGATGTLSPTTVPAGSSLSNVTLTVQLPRVAALNRTSPLGTMPFAFGVLLLPFSGKMGRAAGRRARHAGLWIVLAIAAIAGMVVLSGCGATNTGHSAQQNYAITVTATSGSLSHSTIVNLTVL